MNSIRKKIDDSQFYGLYSCGIQNIVKCSIFAMKASNHSLNTTSFFHSAFFVIYYGIPSIKPSNSFRNERVVSSHGLRMERFEEPNIEFRRVLPFVKVDEFIKKLSRANRFYEHIEDQKAAICEYLDKRFGRWE